MLKVTLRPSHFYIATCNVIKKNKQTNRQRHPLPSEVILFSLRSGLPQNAKVPILDASYIHFRSIKKCFAQTRQILYVIRVITCYSLEHKFLLSFVYQLHASLVISRQSFSQQSRQNLFKFISKSYIKVLLHPTILQYIFDH